MLPFFKNMMAYFNKYKKTVKSSLSIYKAQLYLLSLIKIDHTQIYTAKHSVIYLSVVYSNISDYNDFLKLFLSKTPDDIYIPVYSINRTVTSVSVKNWFIVNNTYIDTEYYLNDFLINVKEFIELYEHYSEQSDMPFNTRKNLDNARPVLNNLFTLLEELSHVK